MPPIDRIRLDEAIKVLVDLSGGLSLDDFRIEQVVKGRRTARRIRYFVMTCGFLFLILSFVDLYASTIITSTNNQDWAFLFTAIWAVALGGLGSVTSIFLDVLKLLPQQTLRNNDVFEVVGRTMLGVLFSFVFSITIAADNISQFFREIHGEAARGQNVMLLVPFLAGYSLPLVLGLLDKAIKAVEMTIGLEDRRADLTQVNPKIKQRGRG